MKFNSKVSILLVFFLLIVFSGCAQISPTLSKTTQVNIKENTPIPVSGPEIIAKPGYYQMINDVIPSELHTSNSGTCVCYHIQSSDVVFDGMGHVIDGSNLDPSCTYSIGIQLADKGGIESRYNNVLIRNITVTHWTEGLQLHGANGFKLENSEMAENTQVGVEVSSSSNIIINNNSLIRNQLFGIVGMDNEDIILSNNTIAYNSHYGINIMGQTLKQAPLDIIIFERHFQIFSEWLSLEKRTSGGRYTIARNEIKNNKNEGIAISGSESNVIEGNVIAGNGQNGIHLYSVDNSVLRNNIFLNNNEMGILSESRGINLIFENNTFSGNKGTIKTTFSTFTNMPYSAIIGTIIIYLFSMLASTSKIAEEIGFSRLIEWKKFKMIEEKISALANTLKISTFLKSNITVSLLGAVILGGVFTYSLSFGMKSDVFLIFSVIGGIVIVTPKIVQYIIAQRVGMQAEYRLWWGGILAVFLTTFVLGNVFGQPVRTAIEREDDYEKKKIALIMLIGPLVSLILSVSFLILYMMRGTYASLALTGLNMSLLTALVTFMPFSPMEGKKVFKWNKFIWVIIFVPILLLYTYFVILH